mgnify:CR=1 FL=1
MSFISVLQQCSLELGFEVVVARVMGARNQALQLFGVDLRLGTRHRTRQRVHEHVVAVKDTRIEAVENAHHEEALSRGGAFAHMKIDPDQQLWVYGGSFDWVPGVAWPRTLGCFVLRLRCGVSCPTNA